MDVDMICGTESFDKETLGLGGRAIAVDVELDGGSMSNRVRRVPTAGKDFVGEVLAEGVAGVTELRWSEGGVPNSGRVVFAGKSTLVALICMARVA